MPRRRLLAPAALAVALVLAAADPVPPSQQLKAVQDQISQGEADRQRLAAQGAALRQQIEQIKHEMVAMAAAMQDREVALAQIEARIADLSAAEADRRHALDLRRQQLQGVLVAMQRLAFEPSEALMAMPLSPADMVRSAILLRAVTPRLKADAGLLRGDLDEIARLRASIAVEEKNAGEAATALASQRQQLADLFAKTQNLAQTNDAQQRATAARLAALAAQASDLRDLLSSIEREQQDEQARLAAAAPPPKPTPPAAALPSFAAAQGAMPFPALGQVISQFGQPDGVGLPAKGLQIQTAPNAQVVAPFAGKIVFAGPFRNYGLLLIIEHSDGYHTLLSGLARIDSSVGQQVLTGEPVGVMGDGQGKQVLYVELRRGGQPIDPQPWLSARKTKVAG